MNRRTALAAAAAVSLSITGLAAAAGATMHVFDVADASPNVGKVSPVSTTTLPPEVEHHVVIVDDPAPVAPAPAPAAGGTEPRQASGSTRSEETHEVAPTAIPAAPAAPAAHGSEPESGHELGDD
jgi:hypothetical protein